MLPVSPVAVCVRCVVLVSGVRARVLPRAPDAPAEIRGTLHFRRLVRLSTACSADPLRHHAAATWIPVTSTLPRVERGVVRWLLRRPRRQVPPFGPSSRPLPEGAEVATESKAACPSGAL